MLCCGTVNFSGGCEKPSKPPAKKRHTQGNTSKKTDFYFQKEDYLELSESGLFMDQLLQQFEGREQCGFYWPDTYIAESNDFAKQAITMIHSIFFDKKKNLEIPFLVRIIILLQLQVFTNTNKLKN